MNRPPLFVLTRIVLPVGFPLLTLGFTGEAPDMLNRTARHLAIFGTAGAAVGLSTEEWLRRRDRSLGAQSRSNITRQLRLLIAAEGVPEDLKPLVHQLIEDIDNEQHL